MSNFNTINKNFSAKKSDPKLDLGIYGNNNNSNSAFIDIGAIIISILWVIFSIFFLTFGDKQEVGSLAEASLLLNCLVVFVPVAMIGTFSMNLKMSRKLKEEALKLQTAVDAMRRNQVAQQQVSGLSVKPGTERKIDGMDETQKKVENEIVKFSTRRETSDVLGGNVALKKHKPNFRTEEPPLPLDGKDNGSINSNISVTIGDFIKAANFPDDENDKDGLASLKNALEDRDLAKLLHATQDSLRIMSKDGIYVDALGITSGKVELWRDFGNGKRGKKLSGIVSFHDNSILEKVSLRFKTDTVFKDVVHHFLRQFDVVFTEFSKNASDGEILEFSKTRTVLTFLILASIAGTFD